ncbi:MAG TPA: isoprenyl synthetase, partial [Dysgonomonas sp.]|nr:isoprenyl synthetase [Dysgonomonas sp.]
MIHSFNEMLEKINASVKGLKFEHSPQSLFTPIYYILELGGKRVRPALSLMRSE